MQREYTCAQCGALFVPRRPTRRYCGPTCRNQARQAPLAARFWAKVRKSDACWEWTGSRYPNGYGQFRGKGARGYAHITSWELHSGPVPDGFWVLHRCDNPPCVRPEHLFVGPPKTNTADMWAKGRARPTGARPERQRLRLHPELALRGEASPVAKLTEVAVREIRAAHAAGGISKRALGARYGVSDATIGFIVRRETWAHVQP